MTAAIRFFVEHRTAANLLLAMMLLAGLGAASQIRSQFFPDFVVESATVRVAWTGAGAEDVDRGVIDALEPSLMEISGVEEVRSIAREGAASLRVEFQTGADLGAAVDEVEAAIDGATALPADAEEPEVERGRFRDVVTYVPVTGPVPVELLDRYAREIRSRLFDAGITLIDMEGEPQPMIRIEPSPAALERYDVSLQDIADAVQGAADTRPLGDLGEGGPRLRSGEVRRSIEALEAVVIRTLPDGSPLTIADLARLRVDEADGAVRYFRDGVPSVQLRVERDAGGDAIRMQDEIERIVAEITPSLPEGVEARLTGTRSQFIKDRLAVLIDNAVWGLAIVLALLFLFLSARTAFWVAAGIPAAMLSAVAIMWLAGGSMNMVSMFALIIALGIVVDDAIVVGEHADALGRRGESPTNAATMAATRMAGPVFSSSITTIIAFAGLTAVGGRFGTLVVEIPFTLIAVLIASLIEAFVILPAHMRHAIAAQARASWIDWPSRQFNRGFDWVRERAVRPALSAALRLRYAVIASVIGLLATSAALFLDGSVRWRFFVGPERNEVVANIAMRADATRSDTLAMVAEMRRARAVIDAEFQEEYGVRPIVETVSAVGLNIGRPLSSADTKDPDLLAGFILEMIDIDERPFAQDVYLKAWRAEIVDHPKLETLAMRGSRSGPGGDAIDVKLSGDAGPRELKAAALALQDQLAALPGVSALEDSLSYDRPELTLTLTPLGRALGFTDAGVAAELRARIAGIEAAKFVENGREVEIRVGFAREALDRGALSAMRLSPPGGALAAGRGVPLDDIVEISESQGFASIQRIDGRRVVQVNGDITDDPVIRDAVNEALEDEILPEIAARFGVDYALGGEREQERDFLGDVQLGAIACLLGIYGVLAWIFASWARPLSVMAAIPLGFIGVIWGHYWFGQPLSMFSVVGILGMAGIVINDSIVLIMRIKELEARRAYFAAVLDGSLDRLRAVVLTTLTTVGGLTPLLFEESQQAKFLQPTVITLVFGLGFGMLLVLLVTPALLLIQRDIGDLVRSARRMLAHLRRPRPRLGGKLGGKVAS